jgi:hypothetical protein
MKYPPYVNTAETDRCRHDRSGAHASLRSHGFAHVIHVLE